MINKIDIELIKDRLIVLESGIIIWKKSKRSDMIGKIAGNIRPDGYHQIEVEKKRYFIHRIVWSYFNGDIPDGYEIDHIDCNKSNNSISNLRLATNSQNKQNKKMATKRSKTGILGVSPARKKYVVRLQKGNKKIREYFNTKTEAQDFYIKEKRRLHEHCTI